MQWVGCNWVQEGGEGHDSHELLILHVFESIIGYNYVNNLHSGSPGMLWVGCNWVLGGDRGIQSHI